MIKKILQNLYRISGLRSPLVYITAEVRTTSPSGLLNGKKVVVTGGTKGLGLAIAKRFVAEGAKVVITGRNKQKTEQIASSIGAIGIPLNLTSDTSFHEFVNDVKSKLEKIDILVNNAGVSLHEKSFYDVTPESYDIQFGTNLRGPFFLTQEIVKVMKDSASGGNVLFISSETGTTADIRPYGLSKASLNSLIKGLGALLVQDNIRVNGISPGIIATEMTNRKITDNLFSSHNTIGRVYLPEEIVEVAIFLVSEKSSTISGQIIECNNARTVNPRWK